MNTRCSCCGALRSQVYDPLVAACDMLVLRSLELVGKRLVRMERSRFARMGDRPFYEAHLLWRPDDSTIAKALDTAWDQVDLLLAEHGCCEVTAAELTAILDRYVHDLLITQSGHSVEELRYRLAAYLGMMV